MIAICYILVYDDDAQTLKQQQDYIKSDFINKFLMQEVIHSDALIGVDEPFRTNNRGYIYSSSLQNATTVCQHTERACTSVQPALTSAARWRRHRTE